MSKLSDTIKGWLAIITIATIPSYFLTKNPPKIEKIQTNLSSIEQKIPLKIINKIEKNFLIPLEKKENNLLQNKINNGRLFKNLNINDFSSKIFDKQKSAIFKFLMSTKITSEEILKYVNNSKILDKNNFRFDVLNINLAKILLRLSKEENVNPRLVLAIYHKESLQGKILTSSTGAIGPLQTMPNTILENCSEFRNRFKSEKEMIKDLYIRIRAGLREIKKIAKGYGININYNSQINEKNISEIVVILASYNAGYGNFKSYPENFLFKNRETRIYVISILSLLYCFDKFIVDEKNGIYV